jgi:hypothetical protein
MGDRHGLALNRAAAPAPPRPDLPPAPAHRRRASLPFPLTGDFMASLTAPKPPPFPAGFAWHMLDRVIAGFARCPLEGCLPW